MLKSLYIKNYALIDSLEIDFESGFSVITGETGAGKSIILGALSLILGQRADIKAIKQGESKCIIEGTFDVAAYDLKDFCEQAGIEYDPQTYILRREILSSGKSRAFISDSPVSLTELKDLGGFLIDIHSQHQNLMLGDTHFQLQVIDSLSGTGTLLKEYRQAFRIYKQAEKSLLDLQDLAAQNKADEDYVRFQHEALSEAKLTEGEQDELEKEMSTLNHAEDIKSALYKIHNLLSDDDKGIVVSLKEGLNAANGLDGVYSNAESIAQRLESAYIDLKDLSSETERSAGDVEFDPERLTFIEERLDQLYSLQQKHRVSSIAELISIYEELTIKLSNIDSYDQQIEELEKDLQAKQNKMLICAEKLSK